MEALEGPAGRSALVREAGPDHAALAVELSRRAEVAEAYVSPCVIRGAELVGGRIEGWESRFKTPESIERKLRRDGVADGTDIRHLSHDALRYTVVLSAQGFAPAMLTVLGVLKEQGFGVDPRNVWNYFVDGNRYKGVHAHIATPGPDAMVFEIQFHTEASLAAKRRTDPLYWQIRDESLSPEHRQQLLDLEREIAEGVSAPSGLQGVARPRLQPVRVSSKRVHKPFTDPAAPG